MNTKFTVCVNTKFTIDYVIAIEMNIENFAQISFNDFEQNLSIKANFAHNQVSFNDF